jgi:hypothetical protein
LEFDPFFFEVFFEAEDEDPLVFFDFGVLNVEGLFAVDFFGLGLRTEENDGWIVVMGVASVMTGEESRVSVGLTEVAEFGD